MPANASVPYFPSDWRGDPGLERCSYGAKGLWHEMNVLMMMADPFGYLEYDGRCLGEGDIKDIADATRGEAKDVRRLLPELKKRKVYSVDENGLIYSRKLVEMGPKRKQRSEAGAKGGAKTAQANAQARALAKSIEQERSSEFAQSHTIPNHTSSPSAREGAGARTRETLVDLPAYRFALWMLREGIERGAVLPHHAQDEFAWCYRHLDDAETLLSLYGEQEAKARGERLIAAKVKRIIRREVTPKALLDSWDWQEVNGAHDLRSGKSDSEDDEFISELRAAEARANG